MQMSMHVCPLGSSIASPPGGSPTCSVRFRNNALYVVSLKPAQVHAGVGLSCAASFVLRSTLPRLAGYGSGICAAVSDANVPDEVAVSLAGFDAASWQSWRHSPSTPLTQLAWNRCRRKCSPRHPFGYSSADAERPATSTAFKSTCREYLYAGSASCFVGGFARFRFMAGSMACQA